MRKKLFDIFIWITTIVLVCIVFLLPDRVPIHWNGNWEVNGYGSRYVTLFIALLPVLSYYGMLLTMRIDPKRKSFKNREKTYILVRKFIVFILVLLAVFLFYMILNPHANGMVVLMCLLGIMFVVMGNYMPKLPQNYFVGVKTPWALADETVWKKTNILGGYIFVILGVICFVCGITAFKYSYIVLMVGSIIDVVVVFVYSYYIFKKIDKNEEN